MIYVERVLKKKRFRKIKKFFIITACVFAVIFIPVSIFVNKNVNPVIISMSSAEVRSLATKIMNTAVTEAINTGGARYSDLIVVITDSNGKIKILQADSIKVNAFARAIIAKSQSGLETIGERGIRIPVGNLTGLPILAGVGPSIKINILPIGAVRCTFASEFSTAGVNQTLHRIYINIISEINVVVPGASQLVTTTTQALVSESILLGDIPQTYLVSGQLDEALNLVPNN